MNTKLEGREALSPPKSLASRVKGFSSSKLPISPPISNKPTPLKTFNRSLNSDIGLRLLQARNSTPPLGPTMDNHRAWNGGYFPPGRAYSSTFDDGSPPFDPTQNMTVERRFPVPARGPVNHPNALPGLGHQQPYVHTSYTRGIPITHTYAQPYPYGNIPGLGYQEPPMHTPYTSGAPITGNFAQPFPYGNFPTTSMGGFSGAARGMVLRENAASMVPSDVQDRKVFAGPLRLMRSESSRDPKKAHFAAFLDSVCPDGAHKSAEYDPIIRNIAYSFTYPMSEDDWNAYQNMLTMFPLANEMQKMLAVGSEQFDQINTTMPTHKLFGEDKGLEEVSNEPSDQTNKTMLTHKSPTLEERMKMDMQQLWPADSSKELEKLMHEQFNQANKNMPTHKPLWMGKTLEDILKEQVERYGLGIPYGPAQPWKGPGYWYGPQ